MRQRIKRANFKKIEKIINKVNKVNWKLLKKRVRQIITSLVILFAVLLLLTTFKASDKFRLLVVNSGSMRPTIKEGSLVFILKQKEYHKNDVITFSSKNQFVTHRIIEVKEEQNSKKFVTKGDANNTADDRLLSPKQVLGKVVFWIPLIGYLIGFTKTLPGLIFLIVIPATIIIYQEILNLKKELGKFLRHKKVIKTLILFALSLLSIKTTLSLYSISASSRNNTFTAGYWETTPAPTSSPTPPPEPTATPTPETELTSTPTLTAQPELTTTPVPTEEPAPTITSAPTSTPTP